jgi:hypothetical protein
MVFEIGNVRYRWFRTEGPKDFRVSAPPPPPPRVAKKKSLTEKTLTKTSVFAK